MLRAIVAAGLLCAAASLAWADAAATLPGTLPLRRGAEPVSDGSLWAPSLLLLGLAAAGGGIVWWRRLGAVRGGGDGSRRPEHTVTRVSSQALTPQASVHTVHWNGEEYLLGCTSQQVTLLARRTMPNTGEANP